MATPKQLLGEFGEKLVARTCACPKCKRSRTLVRLPSNFKCADLICDFCGYLGQVKAATVKDALIVPKAVLGAAWGPQKERMAASIYFPLFLVLVAQNMKSNSIWYLAADLQIPELFVPRSPLSKNAKRAGWQGFYYKTDSIRDRLVRIA